MPVEPQPNKAVKVFYSYSHKDEEYRDELAKHLVTLKRDGVIKEWHDREIPAGAEWDGQINEHLASAEVILLLVSADFLASSYCYDVEITQAMERHEAGEACVIPIILRACDWAGTPFSKLQALPKNARPVRQWEDRDDVFLNIVQGIRKAIKELKPRLRPSTRGQIPRPPVVGVVPRRDGEGRGIIEQLKAELAPGRNQLVTLSGPGGVGKTTLAAEAARELEDVFGGRIVWSNAAARAYTLSTLLDDVTEQLGQVELRALAPAAKEAAVHELVAAAPSLVVLDNCETIEDAEQQRIAAWFGRAQCAALLTSRARVKGTLNVTIPVKMLPDEARELLDRLTGQTQEPGIFSVEVRGRIYETAEANPFLMEWIVAQIDEAREPRTVLEELAHGEGDAAERVFNRSLNLPRVGDDGRAALLALSLFAPSASRPALSEVAGFGDDLKRLDQVVGNLYALWLIKGLDENSRFTIEGLTRSLAAAHLSKDSRAGEFRQRFVAYFLRYARAHAQPTPEDYDALEAEKDNLLNAADVASAATDWGSVMRMANTLAHPVDGVLSVRGYWNEALRLGELALKAARFSQAEEQVAVLTHNVAVMYQMRGQLDEARRLYDESLEINKKLGDQSGIAGTLHQLGRLAQDQGEFDEARRLYGESLEINKKLGDQSGIASTTSQLGIVHLLLGEFAESKVKHEESLVIRLKLGERQGIAIDLHQLGRLAQDQGELAEARRLYGESLEINKKLGNQSGIAGTLHNLAAIAQDQGEFDEARRLYDESLEIKKKLGDQSGIALTLGQLGRLAEDAGNKTEAARLFRETLIIFEKLGSPYANVTRRNLERVTDETP